MHSFGMPHPSDESSVLPQGSSRYTRTPLVCEYASTQGAHLSLIRDAMEELLHTMYLVRGTRYYVRSTRYALCTVCVAKAHPHIYTRTHKRKRHHFASSSSSSSSSSSLQWQHHRQSTTRQDVPSGHRSNRALNTEASTQFHGPRIA